MQWPSLLASDEQMVEAIGFGHLLVTLKKWRSLFQKWPSLWNDEQMAKVIWNDVTLSDRHISKF